MQIAIFEDKKTLVITLNRTGSSVLRSLCDYTNREMSQKRYDYIDFISTKQQEGWEIALCVKDPHERRLSSLEFKARLVSSPEQCAFYLRGLVSGHIPKDYHDFIDTGYIDFTLNDSHMDWGTSCYFHLLASQGIVPRLLFLNRNNFFDWYNVKSVSAADYTEYLENLINHDPMALEHFRSQYQIPLQKYHNHNQFVEDFGLTHTELSRLFLYEIYKKTITEKTHYLYGLAKGHNGPLCELKTVLTFNEWEYMETQMYASMIESVNRDFQDRVQLSKIMIHRIVSRLIECYDVEKMNNMRKHYPGKNLLFLIPNAQEFLNIVDL